MYVLENERVFFDRSVYDSFDSLITFLQLKGGLNSMNQTAVLNDVPVV